MHITIEDLKFALNFLAAAEVKGFAEASNLVRVCGRFAAAIEASKKPPAAEKPVDPGVAQALKVLEGGAAQDTADSEDTDAQS